MVITLNRIVKTKISLLTDSISFIKLEMKHPVNIKFVIPKLS